jgi:hypothetical protein
MNAFLKSSPNSVNIDNFATTSIEAVRRLISSKLIHFFALFKYNLKLIILIQRLNDQKNPFPGLARLKAPPKFCPFRNMTKCDPSYPYRSFDGSCNNLKNPWWGQAEMPYKRLLIPDYADGNHTFI